MKAKLSVLTFKMSSAGYGTDPAPSTSTNVLLAQNVDINPLQMETDDYAPVSNKFGAFEKIVGATWCSVSFDVMVGPTGAPVGSTGNVPNHDPVMRAAAMARVVDPGVSITYSPIDTGEEDAAMYYYVDGILQKMLGLRGDLTWNLVAKRAPMLTFKGMGLNVPMTDVTLPTPTLPTPPRPSAVNRVNTSCVIDGAYQARVSSLSLELGNDVQYRNLTGREDVVVVDRMTKGKITLEMPLLAEKDFLGANGLCTKATNFAMYVDHSNAGATLVQWSMPQVQFFNPKPKVEAGILMLECDIHVVRNQIFVIYR